VNILKIASTSEVSSAAGAVANAFREEGRAELQAIGPKAVNQAVKCIAIARGYVASSGVDLYFVPSFVEVNVSDETRTGIRFTVRSRTPVPVLRPRRRADAPRPPVEPHVPTTEDWHEI
jgi:stage V sporulation protein S